MKQIMGCSGDAKYVRFHQLDPSSFANTLQIKGGILQRSDVAAAMGLPYSRAMIDLSILMGNDYWSILSRGGCKETKRV